VLYEARSWFEVEAWLFGLSTQPRRRSAPLKLSNARNIDPTEIEICKREDGSEYMLGAGSFGEVGAPRFAVNCLPRKTSSSIALVPLLLSR
jgi:hypothetical protein